MAPFDQDGLLNDLDALFQDFYPWLAGQYDQEYGGFYYAPSSRAAEEFQPDIESTAQALSILERSCLIAAMPTDMKEKLIHFFKSRQTEDGYFYDPHNTMRKIERMVGRAIAYSENSLRLLGSIPTYPIPGEGGVSTLPAHLSDPETFKSWMDDRPWDYAWMACDNISVAGTYLKKLPEEQRTPYMNLLWSYLENRQDPDTGMWGGGRPYVKLSGAFKLTILYRSFNKPMPREKRLYKSLLETIRGDASEDMCWTRNTMDLLMTLKEQMPDPPDQEKQEILTITLRNLSRYLKRDGGFSRHVETSLVMPNNIPLGKGLPEGDMNASTQALRVRSRCRQLLGLPDKPLDYAKDFYRFLLKRA